MTIDPRYGLWISVATAVLLFLASATTELTAVFSQPVAAKIAAACTLLGGVVSAVNAVLHAIPSIPGPKGAAQFPLGPKTN